MYPPGPSTWQEQTSDPSDVCSATVASARLDAGGLLRCSCRGAYLNTPALSFRFKNASVRSGEGEKDGPQCASDRAVKSERVWWIHAPIMLNKLLCQSFALSKAGLTFTFTPVYNSECLVASNDKLSIGSPLLC